MGNRKRTHEIHPNLHALSQEKERNFASTFSEKAPPIAQAMPNSLKIDKTTVYQQ